MLSTALLALALCANPPSTPSSPSVGENSPWIAPPQSMRDTPSYSPALTDRLKKLLGGFESSSAEHSDRMDSVTKDSPAVTYSVGWGLLALGALVSFAFQQTTAIAGKPPDHGAVLARVALAAMAMGMYVPLTRAIWWSTQTLAAQIYEDSNRQVMATITENVLVRAGTTIAGNFLGPLGAIYNIRNLLTDFLMMFSLWASAFAIDGVNVLQVVIYNVLYCFGPLMLGLSAFGLPTAQMWLTGMLEVCSWSITGAVVQETMFHRFARQFADASTQGPLNFEWWDALKEMAFLTTCVFFVPVITSRLLGMSALGEFSRAAIHGSSHALAGMFARWGNAGGGASTFTTSRTEQTAPNINGSAERPGD